MTEKLNTGALFPTLTLSTVSGSTIELPAGLSTKYKVILFYRGHW